MNTYSCKWGALKYSLKGHGDITYLFVHNAGGNHRLMHKTMEHFSLKGKVLTLDLRGHGESAAPHIEYSVDGYAQDILELCHYLKLSDLIFVGLNYGSTIGIALTLMSPLIAKLILIEPPILMESWIVDSVKEHIADLKNPHNTNYAEELVKSVLTRGEKQDQDLAIQAFQKTAKHVQISTYENLFNWDKAFKNSSHTISIPTLCIQTATPFCKEEELKKHFLNLQIGRVINSGPWATLEASHQLHPILDSFLKNH